MAGFGTRATRELNAYAAADAVLDAFTDSDFHLGGTDAKGYYLGGNDDDFLEQNGRGQIGRDVEDHFEPLGLGADAAEPDQLAVWLVALQAALDDGRIQSVTLLAGGGSFLMRRRGLFGLDPTPGA